MKNNISQIKELVLYQADKKDVKLEVFIKKETIWLTLNQIAALFNTNKSGISRHLRGIFKNGELNQKSTVAKNATVQIEGQRYIKREIEYYNLDAILSVGYRVNSKKATQFRIWATKVLRSHILQGYSINDHALLENRAEKLLDLQKTIALLREKASTKQLIGREREILDLLSSYSIALGLLDDYDRKRMKKPKGKKSVYKLKYSEVKDLIEELKADYAVKNSNSNIFGVERSNIDGIIKNLYQTFDKRQLYPSIEERSAHLLYFFIKDHPFVDGNKRIGAFLFVYFLNKSDYLTRLDGSNKIDNGTLTALTLLIAESRPEEKETMIKIVMNLLA